jgi:CheY-like chemotaxis protein/anti-sigma regulatory factor (Ser/Thr protein kinase)
VFQAAVDIIRPLAANKRINLQIVVEDHNGIVLGDANRLQQVIWNLLSNAVKFTKEGGTVEARLTRMDEDVQISVTDNGIGIEPGFLPYVFDRFRQADSTSTRRYSGLGLGLAIVRHVVELHGGSVSAASTGKGQGSTFVVRLPLASPKFLSQRTAVSDAKSGQGGGTAQFRKLKGLRVLLVEDDPDTLDMLQFILDQSGAEVISVRSASEALQVLESSHPDALVSDLAMPGQDGYELIGQVRSREPQQGGTIPAIALSAYTRIEDRTRALAAGFQMHVPKPVNPEELVDVVANLMGSR